MMTNKKLYNSIIESAEQMNNEQVRQISEEFTHSNNYLLESFAESYKNALDGFTAQAIDIQKKQNEAMLSSYKSILEDLKREQADNSKHLEKIVTEIKNICIEQNRSVNATLENFIESVKTSISEIKQLIEHETDRNVALKKEMHDSLTHIDQKITEQSKTINDSCEFSKKTCEFIAKKVNELSSVSKSGIDGIKDILSDFSDKQDKANKNYNKEIKRSIEDGFEASTNKVTDDIKPILDKHYEEITDIDKKIEKISSNYEKQLEIIVNSLQNIQDLSSKDVQILKELIEAGAKR